MKDTGFCAAGKGKVSQVLELGSGFRETVCPEHYLPVKTWKQLECPSTDEWIKILYTYTHIHIYVKYESVIKMNEIMPFAVA